MNTRSAFMMVVLFFLFSGEASAQWFSKGDYVVVVENTPAMAGEETVATLSAGTNFRVNKVSGSYVSILQKINGKMVSGWVRQKDVMKIGADQIAVGTTKDDLTRTQGQRLRIPKGISLSIVWNSDHPIDVFVVTKAGEKAYFAALKNAGKGGMDTLASKLNTSKGSLKWNPSDEKQYWLIIDNTFFPNNGASSGKTIHYSLAYCIDDPKPVGPKKSRGIIIGRATIDYDNYKGKNGRHSKSFKVVIDVIDNFGQTVRGSKPKPLKTIEAVIDRNGYFFFENLSMRYVYRIEKFDTSKFVVRLPVTVTFGFGVIDEDEKDKKKKGIFKKMVSTGVISSTSPCTEPSVLDVGHIALRIDKNGRTEVRVDSADASISAKDGSIRFGHTSDGPLERHDWFLKKFGKSEWSTRIRKDRDGEYQQRKESAQRQAELKKEKEKKKK